MKKYALFIAALLAIVSACKTKKTNTESAPVEKQQTASMERNLPLSGTRWTPVEIFGDSKFPAYGQQPYFVLIEKNGDNAPRLEGHGGCNRFFGEFETSGNALKMSNIGATKMYCQETSAMEAKLLEALQKGETYEIKKETLTMYSGKDVVGRFAAMAQ